MDRRRYHWRRLRTVRWWPISFSARLEVTGTIEPVRALSLAPLAVLPAWQRRGIGSRLVRGGIGSAEKLGTEEIIVLGDRDYYQRLEFSAKLPDNLNPL